MYVLLQYQLARVRGEEDADLPRVRFDLVPEHVDVDLVALELGEDPLELVDGLGVGEVVDGGGEGVLLGVRRRAGDG